MTLNGANVFVVFGATIGVFLVGVNTAFLVNLGSSLVAWFKFKIAAVTMLLVYVALSTLLGNPSTWRAAIGLAAMFTDLLAVFWMWGSITRLANKGVIGLVPLIALKPDENLFEDVKS